MPNRSKAGLLAGAILLAATLGAAAISLTAIPGCGESPEEVLARKVLEAERRLSEAQADLYVAFAVAFVAVTAAILIIHLALSERRRRQTLSKLLQWLKRRKPR